MPTNRRPAGPTHLWIIWGSMVVALFIYQFTLGHGLPTGKNAESATLPPIVNLAAAQIFAATVIRWFRLPRARNLGQCLVLMILGLALSEAVEFYGLFLVPASQPETKLALWLASLLSALQFAPLYATAFRPEASAFSST